MQSYRQRQAAQERARTFKLVALGAFAALTLVGSFGAFGALLYVKGQQAGHLEGYKRGLMETCRTDLECEAAAAVEA